MASVIVLCIDVSATTYLPFLFQYLVDALSHQRFPEFFTLWPASPFVVMMSLFACIMFLTKTAAFFQDLLFYPVMNIAMRENHFKIASHMHDISMENYNKLSIPEIISYQKRVWMGARFFLRALLISVVPTLLKFIIAFYVVWSMNIFRSVMVCGLLSMVFIFYLALSWYLRVRAESWTITDRVTLGISDSIFNTKRVRFHKTFESKRLRSLVTKEAKTWFSMTVRMDMIQVGLGAIIALIAIILIGGCAFSVTQKMMTVGQLILLNGQLAAFFIPMRQMFMDLRQMFESSVDLEKIADLFDIPAEKKQTVPFVLPDTLNNSSQKYEWLTFDDVSFQYSNHHTLFQNLSFSLFMGETTFLFGASGAGKSSLLNLMTGLLSPQQGQILLFDQDLRTLSLEEIGKIVHFISQENPLFTGTMWDNLTFGMDHVDEKEVMEALSIMHLDEVIARLPKGVHTPLGEKGAILSGGEKQRVALAHALLLKPLVLIFDETTNAMDAQTEDRVFSVIKEKISTLVFISHKKTNHQGVDRVLEVVKKGHKCAMLFDHNDH